jgi:hypothetical protein
MRMGAALVLQNVERNTRKRRRKKSIRKGRKKRKRKKNGSINLPSQVRVQTHNDMDLTCSTVLNSSVCSQKSNAVAKEKRELLSESNRTQTRGGHLSSQLCILPTFQWSQSTAEGCVFLPRC